MQALQLGSWKELQIHHIAWVPGDMLAIRLFNEATATLDKAKRRLANDWFDITPEFAQQVIRLATDKSGIQTLTHGEMLQKVRNIRKSRIEDVIKRA
ncbi:hypothetical protein [Bradyrhizobium elkanii]